MTDHHRFLLNLQLRRLEDLQAAADELDNRILEQFEPFRAENKALMQIPGIDEVNAEPVLAEIGTDMTVFGSARRLAAWAGVCPGNHESAGRKKSARTRKGNTDLKTTLVNIAFSAVKKKASYYRDKYYRLKARRGSKRAAMAIAHKILVAIYNILTHNQPFKELGESYLDRTTNVRTARNLVKRLRNLGYETILTPSRNPA